ncbi:DUF2334 domain-containing protein [Caulobacter sp. 17J80-11]|uniref:DUF2334 domain-containing protein n=1 Tax=Caulobacter sp. 17J80-11 TaxID=2763502 RepID=UPI0016535A63|nr:DUF2334 domain-containing protein [Caulobacter sp. 17J80-11]MBC6981291.1 DUF2334 domain-containing protein [Caulobacter sp. 17J80-11]
MQPRRSIVALLARLLVALGLGLAGLAPAQAQAPAPVRGAAKPFLVVYDDGGARPELGEVYGVFTANLLGRYGPAEIRPLSGYRAGELQNYRALAYVGSEYDAEPSPTFLADVAASEHPVLWLQHGIHQLAAATPGFAQRFGWRPGAYDTRARTQVAYRGRDFTRRAESAAGLPGVEVTDPAKAEVLATAEGEAAAPVPWAVRSGDFVYVAETPYAYLSEDDRYVAFAALVQRWADPGGPERHRALVRIEDVGPEADPDRLRRIADLLFAEGVPFQVAVYDTYRDPMGRFSGGRPTSFTLKDRPLVVQALRYMVASGGTLVMHGHTHQTDVRPNPFGEVSGGDYEFYGATADAGGRMTLDGPLPDDDESAWQARLDEGLEVWRRAGLARPRIFTTPHYAASPAAYAAIGSRLPVQYEQVNYFPGERAGRPDLRRPFHQFVPYPVRDIRGAVVVPENLGRPAPDQAAAGGRTVEAVIGSAERNLAVRDGFASFYHHWYRDPAELMATVRGVRALGYEFVPAEDAVADLGPLPAAPAPEEAGEGMSLTGFLAALAGLFVGAIGLGVFAARRRR